MAGLATSGLDQRLALDVQGVDALRRTVRNSPDEGMRQVSRQFEAVFMQMVIKSMRDATPSDGLFGSQQEKLYTSMLDQQFAQGLSGRGVGLAEAMRRRRVRRRQWPAQRARFPFLLPPKCAACLPTRARLPPRWRRSIRARPRARVPRPHLRRRPTTSSPACGPPPKRPAARAACRPA
jgi:flagellar protein FlgJ